MKQRFVISSILTFATGITTYMIKQKYKYKQHRLKLWYVLYNIYSFAENNRLHFCLILWSVISDNDHTIISHKLDIECHLDSEKCKFDANYVIAIVIGKEIQAINAEWDQGNWSSLGNWHESERLEWCDAIGNGTSTLLLERDGGAYVVILHSMALELSTALSSLTKRYSFKGSYVL